MKPLKDGHILVFLLAAIILAAVVCVFSAAHFNLDIPSFFGKDPVSFEADWQYQSASDDGTLSYFPAGFYQAELTISKVLPAASEENNVLALQTTYRTVRAYIGDTLIYESGARTSIPFGSVFGPVQHLITLPAGSTGAQLSIQLSGPPVKTEHNIGSIQLGTGASLLYQILCAGLPDIILSVITLVFGLLCVILSFLLTPGAKGYNSKGLLYLGLFMVLASFWTYPGLSIISMFSTNKVWLYMIYYCTFLLTPVPILMFFRSVFHSGKGLLSFLCLLFLYNFVSQFLLYIMNRVELSDTVIITHLLMMLSLACILVFGLIEIFRYKNKVFEIIVGCAGMITFTVIDLLRFYTDIPDGLGTTYYFKHGFLIMIISLAIYSFRERFVAMSALSELEVYQRLAYIDSITKLANRAAYDKEILTLQRNLNTYDSIAILMFDLNNLKVTNDTYGHNAGDELIISFAECLLNVFTEKGHCYRTGGDEFVVILLNRSEAEVQAAIRQLHTAVNAHNSTHLYSVDYAYGYSYDQLTEPRPETLVRLLRQADVNMYTHKRKHRGIHVSMETE